MKLWKFIRIIYRRIIGKPIFSVDERHSDLIYNSDEFMSTQDLFERIAIRYKEAMLVCIEHPKTNEDDTTAVKCICKLSDKSILLSVASDVLEEISDESN